MKVPFTVSEVQEIDRGTLGTSLRHGPHFEKGSTMGCLPSLCRRDVVTWWGACSDSLCAVQGWLSLMVLGRTRGGAD